MQKVAIIGSGIIGAYIALKLKEKGFDVFLYDKKQEKDLGFKPCSTLVSERIRKFIAVPDDCVENIIESCRINFPKKTIELGFNPRHLVLNRDKLIKSQLSLLKEKGVNALLGEDVKEIPSQYDYVIGCDGPISAMRRKLNLKEPRLKTGMQVFVKKQDKSSFTDVFPVKSGFLWQIPRGDFIEYGALTSSLNPREAFLDFLKKQKIEAKNIVSAPVPFSGTEMIFSKDKKVALCGDAMGLTKPWSGGGIIWSLYAADILVRNFPDFEKYEKETRKLFEFKILKGMAANKLVNLIGFNLPFLLPERVSYDNDFPDFVASFVDLIRKR
ncbi:MAG: NAD(P)/FAD-dependent oxidoreductase [Candidatus Pacebacteria bacterium]|nr:NAD(P)/FAD-dependent oxidoreductase [Candidatus Paceibacterota bacterium]